MGHKRWHRGGKWRIGQPKICDGCQCHPPPPPPKSNEYKYLFTRFRGENLCNECLLVANTCEEYLHEQNLELIEKNVGGDFRGHLMFLDRWALSRVTTVMPNRYGSRNDYDHSFEDDNDRSFVDD